MKKNNRITSASYLAFDALTSPLTVRKKPHILIACMPKTASTFFATALAELNGYKRFRLIPDWGSREQELCTVRLSRYNHRKYVAQHHLCNSDWTQTLIQQYNLTPVVLVRNLADCVISLRDHLRKEGPTLPFAHFKDIQINMNDADFEEAIVRLAMPWYMNFYLGWKAAQDVPIYDFDDYVSDPVKTLLDVSIRANAGINEKQVVEALERIKSKKTRYNVGKSGRGNDLSAKAKDALLRLMEFYPDHSGDPLFVKTKETLIKN